jgi:hypothetical protein
MHEIDTMMMMAATSRLALTAMLLPLPAPLSVEARVVVAKDASAVEAWAAVKISELLLQQPDDDTQIAVGHGAAVAIGVDAEALAALGDDAYLLVSGPARGVPLRSVAIASSAQSARGAMNGAFAFLRHIGFEFLAENETIVPTGALVLPPGLDISYEPPFESREMAAVPTAGPGGSRGAPPAFPPGQDHVRLATNISAALGFDGPMAFAPVGGTVGPASPPGYTASAYNLMSPTGSVFACGPGERNSTKKYLPCPSQAADHPEWFACVSTSHDAGPDPAGNHINHNHTTWPCPSSGPSSTGPEGRPGSSQPCWGNVSLIQAMTDNIRALIQQHPNDRIFNLGGMDGSASRIQCPSDAPLMTAANSTGGANFAAANAIAAALARDHPEVRILVDAYYMTQFPPRVGWKFHHNVIVRACLTSTMGYGGEAGLPKELPLTDARNADWIARLKAWRLAAQTVYVWDYTQVKRTTPVIIAFQCVRGMTRVVNVLQNIHYTTVPMPNYFITAENFKTLHELGIKGWFAESVCCHPREEMVRQCLLMA